jgi:hypothetical protein
MIITKDEDSLPFSDELPPVGIPLSAVTYHSKILL